MKKILIHSCCADCLVKTAHEISKDFADQPFSATILYYNPNIHPRTEKDARLLAIKQIMERSPEQFENYNLHVADYRPAEYFDAIKGWKSSKERCAKCWKLRLAKAFEYAVSDKFDILTTTLLSSQYQDCDTIELIMKNLSKETGIEIWKPDTICAECKSHGVYRQNFCGCCYSLTEKLEEKHS